MLFHFDVECFLCSLKKGVGLRKCLFCSGNMADFDHVFDDLDSETSSYSDGAPISLGSGTSAD